MAQYEHLPIYKKAMYLAVYVEKVAANFSRYHKYTLGSEMRALSHGIAFLAARANSLEDKREALLEAREKIEAR